MPEAPAPSVVEAAQAVKPVVPDAPFPTLLALDDNSVWTFRVTNSKVVVKGDVVIDSSNRGALWVADSSLQLREGALQVAGGYTHLGDVRVSPAPAIGGATVADPLAEFRVPSDLKVISNEKLFLQTSANDEDTVLPPGIYSGGIFATGDGNIRLQPGVYVFYNGDFSAIGPRVMGENVTLILAGDQAGRLDFALGAKLIASAPTTGQLKDLVIVSRASGGLTKAVSFAGGGARLDGIVYAPKTQFNLTSGADVRATKVICQSCSADSSQLELTGDRVPNEAALTTPTTAPNPDDQTR